MEVEEKYEEVIERAFKEKGIYSRVVGKVVPVYGPDALVREEWPTYTRIDNTCGEWRGNHQGEVDSPERSLGRDWRRIGTGTNDD